jgi:hypothetical protein
MVVSNYEQKRGERMMKTIQSLSMRNLSELRSINSFFQYDHNDIECLDHIRPLLSK